MHPDVNKAPDAEERFKEVSEAYETLSDPDKRARYDAVRAGGFTTQNPYAGRGGTGQGGSPFGGMPFDPFGPFWGGAGSPWGSATVGGQRRSGGTAPYSCEPGAPRRVTLTLTADEARHGAAKTISFERFEPCSACSGRGTSSSDGVITCPMCHGRGSVQARMQTFMGDLSQTMRCPECNGSGKVIKDPCPSCSGNRRAPVAGDGIGQRARRLARRHGPARQGGGRRPAAAAARAATWRRSCPSPSEHLTSSQEFGFTVAGVVLALLACTLFAGTIMRLLTFLALPLFFVFFMFPMGGRKKGGSFWNRAARRIGFGLLIGFFIFIVFMPFMSCARILF